MRGSLGFGPSELPRSLAAALRDVGSSKIHVRRSAARDLARHVNSSARGQVVQRLLELASADSDTEVRVQAILALADGDATESTEELTRLAAAAIPRVRQMALLALGELAAPSDPEVVQAAHLATGSEFPALRYQGLVALRHVAGLQALAALSAALADADAEVRWVALRLVDELSSEAPELTGDEPSPPEWVIDLIPLVRPVLSDTNPRVATAACLLLAGWGEADSLRQLAVALGTGRRILSGEDQMAAIRAIGRWRFADARPALEKRAWPLLFDGALAFEARVALVALGDPRARQSILNDLHSGVSARCARAIEPVGRLKLVEGRARLAQLLGGSNGLDTEMIRRALNRLSD